MKFKVNIEKTMTSGKKIVQEIVITSSSEPPTELDILNFLISEKRLEEFFVASDMIAGTDRRTRLLAQLGIESLEIIRTGKYVD